MDDFGKRVFLHATKIGKNGKILSKEYHYFVPYRLFE